MKFRTVAELLPDNPNDAISQKVLCDITGLDSTALKEKIQQERREGALIGSGVGGYFLAQDQQQLTGFYSTMEFQAKERLETIRLMKCGGMDQYQQEKGHDVTGKKGTGESY